MAPALFPGSEAIGMALLDALSRPLYFRTSFQNSLASVDLTKEELPLQVTCQETVATYDKDKRWGRHYKQNHKKQFVCEVQFSRQVSADIMEQNLALNPIIMPPFERHGATFVLMDRVLYSHPPEQDPNKGSWFSFQFIAIASGFVTYSLAVPPIHYAPAIWMPSTSIKQTVQQAIVNALAPLSPLKTSVQETDCRWTDSRNKRSLLQEREAWTWQAHCSFANKKSIDEIEHALSDRPIIIGPDPAAALPALFVDLASIAYAHPPEQSPNRGSVVAFTFNASHR